MEPIGVRLEKDMGPDRGGGGRVAMIRFPDGNGDGGLARRILAELESRVARRLPHWTARGPDSAGNSWVTW